MKKKVFNLEFSSWCAEINIFGYRFYRTEDYEEKVSKLQHFVTQYGEFNITAKTGSHQITAFVEYEGNEEKAVFEWQNSNNTALDDILLLLTLFTGRDVFSVEENFNGDSSIITNDSRRDYFGGILRTSLPDGERVNLENGSCYITGFEVGLNQIYNLIRTGDWQKKYEKGYFLLLAKNAFKRQILEASFVQCWTIWEHLFTIHNRKWMSDNEMIKINSFEKISFLLVEYALKDEIDGTTRKHIEWLSKIRNRLIHFGRFPEGDSINQHAVLFIQLTEFIIAKVLGLLPSNLYNTIENLEVFLSAKK